MSKIKNFFGNIKDFFVTYGGVIGKLVINHIAMSIFGLMVCPATFAINKVLYWCACVLGVGMYMFLLYMVMWELGSKEQVDAEYGKVSDDKLKGLKISLVKNSIFIIIAILVFILSFCITPEVSAVNSVYGALKSVMQLFILSIYLPFLTTFSGFDAILLILLIPEIVCCAVSYWAGVTGKKCLFPDKKKK